MNRLFSPLRQWVSKLLQSRPATGLRHSWRGYRRQRLKVIQKRLHSRRSTQAYVIYRMNKREQRRAVARTMYHSFLKHKTKIKNSPVFLDKTQALDYLKYIDHRENLMIKVSIPQSAIVGKYGGLELNKECLDFCRVHDYVVSQKLPTNSLTTAA